ncbi:MAG TPA: hypothetical protein PKN24_02945 [bacterium]|nr:hypothetical protein [bacterium]
MRVGLLAVALFSSAVIGENDVRIRGSNKDYRPGDWITFSTTRFIRSVSIGQECIYFATTGGICRYNFFRNGWESPWTVSSGLADNDVKIAALDNNTGYVWAVTERAICYLDPASNYWTNAYFDELGIFPAKISAVGFSDDRQVYLLTSRQEVLVSEAYGAFFSRVDAIDFSKEIIWHSEKAQSAVDMPTFFMPMHYLFDADELTVDDGRLRSWPLTAWAEDSWQNLWIGTWGLGAGRGNLQNYNLEMLPFGLWSSKVGAIAVDSDRLWLAGAQTDPQTSGITVWNPGEGEPEYFEPRLITGFYQDEISSIAVDGETVWFGSRGGLTRYDRQKQIWRTCTQVDNLIDDWVQDIVVDDSSIWVATAGGVSRVVKKTVGTDSLQIRPVMHAALSNLFIYDLEKQENLLWIATEFGIYVYDIATGEGGFFKGAAGPSNQETYAISSFGDEIWFATEEGVAALDSQKKEWLPPPARLYESNLRVYRLLADEYGVWAATADGVRRFDRRSDRWIHYGVEDGLPASAIYAICLDEDYIWFGGEGGLTRFYWNSPGRID